MTKTDKIEIDNLLNSAKEMKDYANKVNGIYVDDSISNFAKEAKIDFLSNKNYIKNIIQDNLNIFFDLNNFEVSTGGACTDGYSAMRGEIFSVRIKNTNLRIYAILTDATTIKNTGYNVFFKVRSMKIVDVCWYTSDTDDSEYKICSSWDLVGSPHDDIVKIPFNTPKNVKGWNLLYNYSLATRAKNSQLVRKFKECLQSRISDFRAISNKNELIKNNLDGVSKQYIKVDL